MESAMTIDPNDPRITAYALGELEEKERADIEAQLAQSLELRRAVNEISETAKLLKKGFQSEPVLSLSNEQRAAVETQAVQTNGHATEHHDTRSWLIRRWWIPTSLAASWLIIVGAGYILLPSMEAARRAHPEERLALLSRNDNPLRAKALKTVDRTRTNTRATSARKSRRMQRQPYTDFGSSAPLIDLRNATSVVEKETDEDGLLGAQVVTAAPSGSTSFAATLELFYMDNPAEWASADLRNGDVSHAYQVPFFADGHARFVRDKKGSKYDALTGPWSTEAYDQIVENTFLLVTRNPLSTFSIDVDTASYANVRRFLNQDVLPPSGAVRIEEMVNYFNYNYPLPTGDDPFSVNVEVADCPWNGDHLLARIGIKGQEFTSDERPPANLVFLIDVSGSMQPPNKLPLLKEAMRMLVDELAYDDYVAIAVYAGASGLVLPSTSCEDKSAILSALDHLQAGGSTNGGAGIQLAYDTAVDNFIEGGVNRVILATDGDFNVGVTNQGELISVIEEEARSGFLSVLGFGMGNYKDSTLEKLADKGNGNYAYIDTQSEAQKVLVDQMAGTLVTIAKDVKIQIEFNPAEVNAYRLIGYENRLLRAEDFNDDTKDAGEIGAGHTVTAFFEIVPAGIEVDLPDVDPLKYQWSSLDARLEGDNESEPGVQATDEDSRGLTPAAWTGELMTVKLRYKQPDGDVSKLIEVPVIDGGLALSEASNDFVFAASVTSFGMLLRGSQHSGDFSYDAVLEMASGSIGDDAYGYREEFVFLVEQAIVLQDNMPRRDSRAP